MWVTWRERAPQPRPAPRPFDRREITDVVRRLQRERFASGSWRWDWAGAGVVPGLSAEGARFWLAAMLRPVAILGRPYSDGPVPDPAEVVRALESHGSQIPLDVDALQTVLSAHGPLAPEGIIPLATLLPPEGLVELLTRERRSDSPGPEALMGRLLVSGYRRYVLPYLAPDEMVRLRQQLLPRMDPAGWDSSPRRSPNGAYFLGAMLGAHEPLRRLVQGWPDGRYRGQAGGAFYERPQEIVFGLGSAEEVERQMRRLGLTLREPEYVRAWLAHTGYGALDLVRDSVLAVERREPATELCAALGLVVAPEASPLMLELMHTSTGPRRGPGVAGSAPGAGGRRSAAPGRRGERLSRGRRVPAPALPARAGAPDRRGPGGAGRRTARSTPVSAAGWRESLFEREDDRPPLDEFDTRSWLARALGELSTGGGARRRRRWCRGPAGSFCPRSWWATGASARPRQTPSSLPSRAAPWSCRAPW